MTVLPASGRPRCLWEEMKLKRNSSVVSGCVTTYQSTLVFLLPMLIFGVIALEFEFTLIQFLLPISGFIIQVASLNFEVPMLPP